jgi:uncharacterized glyoxalase superfamily protein PhnB
MQTIFPILRYENARSSIAWLCEAFGFTEVFAVPETGEFVRHAQLTLGTNRIMLGSLRDDGLTTPRKLDGMATQSLSVYVAEVDEHFARALGAGAEIVLPPQDTDFGTREYHAKDPEGHTWTFSNYLPSAD